VGSQQAWVSGGSPPGCSPGVSMVNPAATSLVTHLTAGGASSGNALGAGGFWFGADKSDLLNRVDTATDSVVGQLKLPGSPGSIATGFGSVWVANQTDSAILRVAPADVYGAEAQRLGLAGGQRANNCRSGTPGSVRHLTQQPHGIADARVAADLLGIRVVALVRTSRAGMDVLRGPGLCTCWNADHAAR
jgi:streptogramin lyase